MKEYTLLALIAAIAAVVIDRRLDTRVTSTRTFWTFLLAMIGFMTIVNGYLTWRPVVLYGEKYFLNIRLLTIPVEDFLYAFSVITLSVVLWEHNVRGTGKSTLDEERVEP